LDSSKKQGFKPRFEPNSAPNSHKIQTLGQVLTLQNDSDVTLYPAYQDLTEQQTKDWFLFICVQISLIRMVL